MTLNSWFTWALLSAFFTALTAIFAKIGLEKVDSDYASLIRTFVIVFVLAVFVGVTNKWQNPFLLNWRTAGILALSGAATGASWICYFRALKMGEASKVDPVDKLSLMLVALFAVTCLGERPNVREWLGIAMVGIGAVVLGFKR